MSTRILRLFGNRVLVKPIANVAPGGIVIPETVQPRTEFVEIMMIGEGSKIPKEMRVGQRLKVDTAYGAEDVWLNGVKHQIVSIYDTLAIMDYAD